MAAKTTLAIEIKRIYEPASRGDGYRVLVDRIWPRGLSKDKAVFDEWLKEVAPSTELRRWFGHDPARWTEFRARYFHELRERHELLQPLATRARRRRVTLLFGTREERFNNAAALRDYLRLHPSLRRASAASGAKKTGGRPKSGAKKKR